MQLRALNAGDAVVVASFAPYSVEAQTVAQIDAAESQLFTSGAYVQRPSARSS